MDSVPSLPLFKKEKGKNVSGRESKVPNFLATVPFHSSNSGGGARLTSLSNYIYPTSTCVLSTAVGELPLTQFDLQIRGTRIRIFSSPPPYDVIQLYPAYSFRSSDASQWAQRRESGRGESTRRADVAIHTYNDMSKAAV